MKRTFLYRVFKHNRILFGILLVFMLGTVVCNLVGVEITPFFVWGMYSEKEQPVTRYELLQTRVNDSLVLDVNKIWSNDTRFYLTGPLAYYQKVRDIDPTVRFLNEKLPGKISRSFEKKLFNTDLHPDAFMGWYARYLQTVLGQVVHTLQLDLVQVHFDGSRLVTDTIYSIDEWEP